MCRYIGESAWPVTVSIFILATRIIGQTNMMEWWTDSKVAPISNFEIYFYNKWRILHECSCFIEFIKQVWEK